MSSPKFLLPFLCLATALTARGAGNTRFNAASGDWGDSGNWTTVSGTPSAPPGSGDTVVVDFAGGSAISLAGDFTVSGFQLSTASSLTGLSSLRTLTVTGLGFTSAAMTLDNVKLSKTTSSALSLGAGVILQNGGVLSLGSGASITLNTGAALGITSGGGTGNAFEVVGTGVASVSGGTGSFTVASGVGFSSVGTLSLLEGTLDVQSSSASLAGAMNFSAFNSATFKTSGTMTVGALTVGGSGSNGGTDIFENVGTLNLGAGGVVAFNAPGAGNYTVRNAGSGTMNLNSGNAITLSQNFVQADSATLNFNSPSLALNSSMTINGGSVVGSWTGGTGSGTATFNSGATLAPGAAGSGNIGSIAFPGALALASGSTLSLDINGNASYDQVSSGGAVSLSGATLGVARNGPVTIGTVFNILSGSSLSGTFSGLAEGATVNPGDAQTSFLIRYGTLVPNTVTLTAVPEPRFYAGAVGLGLLGFGLWRRKAA